LRHWVVKSALNNADSAIDVFGIVVAMSLV